MDLLDEILDNDKPNGRIGSEDAFLEYSIRDSILCVVPYGLEKGHISGLQDNAEKFTLSRDFYLSTMTGLCMGDYRLLKNAFPEKNYSARVDVDVSGKGRNISFYFIHDSLLGLDHHGENVSYFCRESLPEEKANLYSIFDLIEGIILESFLTESMDIEVCRISLGSDSSLCSGLQDFDDPVIPDRENSFHRNYLSACSEDSDVKKEFFTSYTGCLMKSIFYRAELSDACRLQEELKKDGILEVIR